MVLCNVRRLIVLTLNPRPVPVPVTWLCPGFAAALCRWNVHWQCGSNYIKGCREAATQALNKLVNEHMPSDEAVSKSPHGLGRVMVSVELEETSWQPLNLAQHGLPGSWAQVNGSCPPTPPSTTGDALALLLGKELDVQASGGGCLGGKAGGGYKTDSRAFAVALVKPRVAVTGCSMLCIVGTSHQAWVCLAPAVRLLDCNPAQWSKSRHV